MKKILVILALSAVFFGCATAAPVTNSDEVSLSTAIRMTASQMETNLDKGTKVALINFTSPSAAFSEYVLDELSSVLVNNRVLVVVDRSNLDKIRQELGFNTSGEVSDQSAQEMGKILGAQALVTGNITSIGKLRRIMFKVVTTETATVVVQQPADIINDERVQALLAQGGGTRTAASVGSSRTNNASGSQVAAAAEPAEPPKPAGPQNGTYTIWPRLRPMKAGLAESNAFIGKITVTKDYMVIHFARSAQGPMKDGEWDYGPSGFYDQNYFVLQDLDNPSRSYNPVSAQSTDNGMGKIWNVSFNRVNATRFKLTCKFYSSDNPPYVFEEIIIPDEPDK